MTKPADEVNSTALAYLQDYCSPERVRDFAVLLDGPWGAGKTYFIKRFLESKPKHLYVSLYGMTDVRQIDDEFYRQLHPVLSSKGMRILGAVGKAVAKGALKIDLDGDGKDDGTVNFGLPDIDLKAGLADPRERLLVFDDLERCPMPVSVVLGYINAFVEHDGLKAIIVANETEVLKRKDERYAEIKEKLIGQTLRISATVESAYVVFLENIADPRTKEFLARHRDRVIGVHKQSGTNNLRALKQAMWDYERVARHFTGQHWQNEQAMLAVMSVMLSLSIEHRTGRLTDRSQIERLINGSLLRAMRRQAGDEKSIEDQIDERYPQVDFDDPIIDATTLADAVLDGRADEGTIRAALGASRRYATPESVPLWQRAWGLFDATDDEADALIAEFKQAFDERQFKERGVIFHAFGILLRYTRRKLLPMSTSDAVAACKSYVDDLVKQGELPVEERPDLDFDRLRIFGRHEYMDSGTSEFAEVVKYFDDAADRIAVARYPEDARALLDRLADGADDYVLDLCNNNVRASRFDDVPVLAALEPEEFVSRILELRPDLQRRATETLKHRYERRGFHGALAAERPWLEKVRELLREASDKARPMSADRLRSMVEGHLDPVLAASRSET